MIETTDKSTGSVVDQDDNMDLDRSEEKTDSAGVSCGFDPRYDEANAVFHIFNLFNESDGDVQCENIINEFTSRKLLKIRELPITRPDNPFGNEERPEDDTTGLGIWPSSVVYHIPIYYIQKIHDKSF